MVFPCTLKGLRGLRINYDKTLWHIIGIRIKSKEYDETILDLKQCLMTLKVHKIENFFGSEFEFYTISLLVMLKYKGFVKIFFDWAMNGGDTIIPGLRLRGIEFSLV